MTAALSFVAAPPGLDPLTEFSLSEVEGADGLFTLTATEREGVRLFLLDAAVHLPAYAPVISLKQRESLGVESGQDPAILVVANPGENGVAVNLLAPIVVNTGTGRAAQFILDDQDYPVRAALSAVA